MENKSFKLTPILDKNLSIKENLLQKGLKGVGLIATCIGGLIGYAIGRFLGWTYLIFLVLYGVILWYAYSYLKKKKTPNFLVSIIVWSNVLTWLLPPLGIFTSVIAIGLAHNTEQKNKRKYKIFAIIGLTLSIINMMAGAYQGFMKAV